MKIDWATNEFKSANLGDDRLKQRLIIMANRFSDSPESPINQACDNWAETKAAYRFFQNGDVKYKEIIRSHCEATQTRCQDYSTVLAIQDTTYFTYSSHPGTTGLCPLSRKQGKHKEAIYTTGLVMHTALAVSPDGLPLGIIDQKIYSRPKLSDKLKRIKRKSHNIALPVEEKDNYRWIESLNMTSTQFKGHPSRVVTIGDREADMYDLFQRADSLKESVLIRACYNRTVNKRSMFSEKSGETLWNLLTTKEVQANITVSIPEQKGRPAREAQCAVTFSQFTMHPPHNYVDKEAKNRPALILYAVYVTEKKPPPNVEPIDWMLITNIPILTATDAIEKVRWYSYRWRIEIFHKILKSGLKVEDCRLSQAERLIRYLSVMSVVAWRIFWITLIARVSPNTTCSIFLTKNEWKILFVKINHSKDIPRTTPSIKLCVKWIAQLGGFLARKSDKYPGITHIWRGIKKFNSMLDGAEISGLFVGNR